VALGILGPCYVQQDGFVRSQVHIILNVSFPLENVRVIADLYRSSRLRSRRFASRGRRAGYMKRGLRMFIYSRVDLYLRAFKNPPFQNPFLQLQHQGIIYILVLKECT
jgi:hypothetical protein